MNSTQRLKIWRIAASLIIFALSFLLPESGPWRMLICICAYLIAAYDVLLDAVGNIINGQVFDEKFLMALATIGAFVVGESHEAVFVMVFFQIGELFESIAVGKSRKSVAALMEINPDYANILVDGALIRVSPEELSPGDVIIIKPGERIPVDGIILAGESSINTSALTGESLPRDVAAGDAVISGCVNIKGLLNVRVTKPLEESTVTRILELVEQSAASKSKSENFITRFARWYTPVVVVLALVLALLPPIFVGNWSMWIHRALIFLVISCPCALVISVPLTYFGGIGYASRNGILIKGSNYLDVLGGCRSFIFDKTGTLTKGQFTVKEISAANGEEDKLIEYASYAEAFSDHPIAASIKTFFGKEIDKERISFLEESSGYGVRAIVDGRSVLTGGSRLMEKEGIAFEMLLQPGTHVYVAVDGLYLGSILIADEAKEDAAQTVTDLKALGVKKNIMLTGDSRSTAEAIAAEIEIDTYHFGLLPEEKLKLLEKELMNNIKYKTAYIGDGINDAPCLSRADLGIAMGALGSDAAIEAADIVIMDDKLSRLPMAVRIAHKTSRIVRQNIIFALGVKFAILILGALGLAGMWSAVFADVGVCVIAILNAMRTQK